MRPPDQEGDDFIIESDLDRVTRITNDYLVELPVWRDLESAIVPMVESIAEEFDRPMHVEHRVKPLISLERKLLMRSREVTELHQITDLLGTRIVTLHLDSIGPIVASVEAMFHVDRRKSGLRTNLAGYRTRHVVCALPTGAQPQWFEIQIRTVGEHAWSELQHPIYKGAAADESTTQTLVKIATLYHEAESLAAGLRRRFQSGHDLYCKSGPDRPSG
jgi:ppGpp synthetase/RelA/SpoT-type nucleotidyltranferase